MSELRDEVDMDRTDAVPAAADAEARREAELEAALGEEMPELPPNIPPGFLGEIAPDFRKIDDDGPHGLNAGVIQETTWETTVLWVALAYLIFFPAAFYILWRSDKVLRSHKVVLSAAMVGGLVAFGAWWYANG